MIIGLAIARPSKTRWEEPEGNREVYPVSAHGHTTAAINRLLLRGVLHDVSPLVARVLAVSDDLELTDLHEVFLAMLDWNG